MPQVSHSVDFELTRKDSIHFVVYLINQLSLGLHRLQITSFNHETNAVNFLVTTYLQVSQARPNQSQRGSLSASRTGKYWKRSALGLVGSGLRDYYLQSAVIWFIRVNWFSVTANYILKQYACCQSREVFCGQVKPSCEVCKGNKLSSMDVANSLGDTVRVKEQSNFFSHKFIFLQFN